MSQPHDLFPFVSIASKAMLFVDGENLAIRYGKLRRQSGAEAQEKQFNIRYEKDVAVWADHLNADSKSMHTYVLRRHYYTSVRGDPDRSTEVADWLKLRGFEAPRVFRRSASGRSKQVDITLSVEMLTHATRKHYDIAILVAGDADYVPLVRAVKAEGARVHGWFLSQGLSSELRRECDHFCILDTDFAV